jgi:eukaryotic-like serine/threonine-protein kinase
MSSDELREGQILAGKYRVERQLGAGGMGVVLAAVHIELEQRVAIKVLKRDLAESDSIAERFRREARAACRIRSPHGARVLDVGTTEDGLPYMVMEYLDGHDLAAELERRGQLPYEEAAAYVIQAADAICDAHDENIIHRDIKPANLFLTERAGLHAVKVLDFGISKSLQDTNSANPGLTHTQALIGSPMYMSPEQLDSPRTVDARTDIWSLGIVLYELVTGRPPFSADGIAGLIKQIVADTPPRLANFGVDAPAEFEAIIERCLAKKRDDRFPSVRELMLALAPFAKDSPMSVPMATRAAFGGRVSTANRSSSAARSASNAEAPMTPVGLEQSLLPRPTSTQRHFPTRVATGNADASAQSNAGTLVGGGAVDRGSVSERGGSAEHGSMSERGSATATDRVITPFGQSHTRADEPPKKPMWPWLVGVGALAAVAAAFVLSNGEAADSTDPIAANSSPRVVATDAADEATSQAPLNTVAANSGPTSGDTPVVTPAPDASGLSNPSPSSTTPEVKVEPTPEVGTAPVHPPARPPKKAPKPPREETPAPKPPSGISDFGGRH